MPSTSRTRFEPLSEFQQAPRSVGCGKSAVDTARVTALVFGGVLIAAGIALAVWLAVVVHRVLLSPNVPAIVQRLTPTQPEDMRFLMPSGGKLEIPTPLYGLVGHVIALLLLLPATAITLALIRNGVLLLRCKSSRPAEPGPAQGSADTDEPAARTSFLP